MQKLIARLIDCGVPRITAVYLCQRYCKLGKMKELEQYVDAVEAETRVLEDV